MYKNGLAAWLENEIALESRWESDGYEDSHLVEILSESLEYWMYRGDLEENHAE